jgi:hypothetical protein
VDNDELDEIAGKKKKMNLNWLESTYNNDTSSESNPDRTRTLKQQAQID